MNLNINIVKFVKSSELFAGTSDAFKEYFSSHCEAVSYGDANYTLIDTKTMTAILDHIWEVCEEEASGNADGEDSGVHEEVKEDVENVSDLVNALSGDVYIDLEN